jgi:hypothetical protein
VDFEPPIKNASLVGLFFTILFYNFDLPMLATSKYTPFTTLSSATRSFCNGKSGYSFRFNGQEQDNEVAGNGNIMTAEFWEYDTRLGRRWNLDPKSKLELSPFSCLGNSPIIFNDPKGDIFGISKDKDGKINQKAKTDILNLANENNRQFISFDDNGIASLNFGPRSKLEIEEILEKDKGISLINDLINAKDKKGKDLTIIYDVSDENSLLDKETGEIVNEKYHFNEDGIQTNRISNLSTTPRNVNGGIGPEEFYPIDGINGFVRITPGSFFNYKNPQLIINRSSMVYHELMENYARTVLGLPYVGPKDGSYIDIGPSGYPGYGGAHNYSVIREGLYYGNPFPGASGKFTHE